MAPDDPLVWLRESGAQGDVIDGLRAIVERVPPGGGRWHGLWVGCPRGDWLLGIAVRLGVEPSFLVRAAIACARTAIADEAELASGRRVLEVTARWLDGLASIEDVQRATAEAEAEADRAQAPTTAAALRSALSVGMGVTDGEMLASAASFAAEAMMMATLDCGMPLVMGYAHGKGAEAVRSAIPWSIVEARVFATSSTRMA